MEVSSTTASPANPQSALPLDCHISISVRSINDILVPLFHVGADNTENLLKMVLNYHLFRELLIT
jgi:hypothetical protein